LQCSSRRCATEADPGVGGYFYDVGVTFEGPLRLDSLVDGIRKTALNDCLAHAHADDPALAFHRDASERLVSGGDPSFDGKMATVRNGSVCVGR